MAGRRYFVMRFRWVDPSLWAKLGKELPQMTPFASAGEVGVRHCPGCGADLKRWAEEHPNEFDAMLRQVVD